MKRLILLLLTCSLLFLSAPISTSHAAVISNECSTVSGKLVAMTRIKERYQLTVGPKVVYIVDDGSQQNRAQVETARSLLNKPVTVVYISGTHRVVTIFPAQKTEEK